MLVQEKCLDLLLVGTPKVLPTSAAYFLHNYCQEMDTLYNQDQTSVILGEITEYSIGRFVQLGLFSPVLKFCNLLERGCTQYFTEVGRYHSVKDDLKLTKLHCFCRDLRYTYYALTSCSVKL